MKISLDTNVFLALMNKEPLAPYCEMIFDAIDNNSLEPFVSTIVIAEVLVGFCQNNDLDGKHKFLNKIQLKYHSIPVSLSIAENGAEIRAFDHLKLPDALIYATALASNVDILISNDLPLTKKGTIPILTPKGFVDAYSQIFPKKR